MPEISVIMGVYNVKNFQIAKDAIISVLHQTFKDFEFIICNDGSQNNTLNIIRALTKDDPRVKIINNTTNMGLAFSLNNCLKEASGQYIARMDIDDISHLSRFEQQYNFLEKHKEYALVSSWAELFRETTTWGIRKYKIMPEKKDFLFGSPILHAGMMIRKEILISLGGYRLAWETRRAEDYDLFMRLYSLGYKAYCIPSCLYKIREDNDAFKRRSYGHRLEECIVRYKGFKCLKLFPVGYIYILKPLIVGLIPQQILKKLRNEEV